MLESMFAEYDGDYSDSLSLDEVSQLIAHVYAKPGTEGYCPVTISALFEIFDKDGSGEIRCARTAGCKWTFSHTNHREWKKVIFPGLTCTHTSFPHHFHTTRSHIRVGVLVSPR